MHTLPFDSIHELTNYICMKNIMSLKQIINLVQYRALAVKNFLNDYYAGYGKGLMDFQLVPNRRCSKGDLAVRCDGLSSENITAYYVFTPRNLVYIKVHSSLTGQSAFLRAVWADPARHE